MPSETIGTVGHGFARRVLNTSGLQAGQAVHSTLVLTDVAKNNHTDTAILVYSPNEACSNADGSEQFCLSNGEVLCGFVVARQADLAPGVDPGGRRPRHAAAVQRERVQQRLWQRPRCGCG